MKKNIHDLDEKLHADLLAQMRKDPVTGELIRAGDSVVFCKSCGSAFHVSSWEYLGEKHCGQSETLDKIPENKLLNIEWTLKKFVNSVRVEAISPKQALIGNLVGVGFYASLFLFFILMDNFQQVFSVAFGLIFFNMIRKYIAAGNAELICYENALFIESGKFFWKKKQFLKEKDIKKITIFAYSHKEKNYQTVSVLTQEGKSYNFEAKWDKEEILNFIKCYAKTIDMEFLTGENEQLHILAQIENIHTFKKFSINPINNILFETLPENVQQDFGNPIYFSSDKLTRFKDDWSFVDTNIAFFKDEKENRMMLFFSELIRSQAFNWLLILFFVWLSSEKIALILAGFAALSLINPLHAFVTRQLFPTEGISFYERGLSIVKTKFLSLKSETFFFNYEEIARMSIIVRKNKMKVVITDINGIKHEVKLKNLDYLDARKEFYNSLSAISHRISIDFKLTDAFEDQRFLNALVTLHGSRFMLSVSN